MKNNETIEGMTGCVTIHVMLPPDVLKAAVKLAKAQGHNDLSLIAQQGLQRLMEREKQGLPLT